MLQTLNYLLKIPNPLTLVARNYFVPIRKKKTISKEYFVFRLKMKSKYRGNPNPMLNILLLEDIDRVGMKGDVVKVKRKLGRHHIYRRAAVYATEENLIARGIDPAVLNEDLSPKVSPEVVEYFKKHHITLRRPPYAEGMGFSPWFITSHDICRYFELKSRLMIPVTCVKILGCTDNLVRKTGQYTVQVTLNNIMTMDVPLTVKENFLKDEVD